MNEAFQFLKQVEEKSLASAGNAAFSEGDVEEWNGIGFKISDIDLLTSMDDVSEILDMPPYTKVPGVKHWVVGIANVRGSLLPLMDVKEFITGTPMINRNVGRVMVVKYKGLHTGLIVEEVQGMRHFSLKDQKTKFPEVDSSLKPYVKHAFEKDNNFWPVFSLQALIDDERFLHASL